MSFELSFSQKLALGQKRAVRKAVQKFGKGEFRKGITGLIQNKDASFLQKWRTVSSKNEILDVLNWASKEFKLDKKDFEEMLEKA